MFVTDFGNVMGEMTVNGRGGPVAESMRQVRWDSDLMRPYFDRNGRPSVTVNLGRTTLVKGVQVPLREHCLIRDLPDHGLPIPPVANATTLRKEQWIEMDRKILLAARYRLRALSDLGASSTYGGFNGMATPILEHETMTDTGEAIVDMDGIAEGRADSPRFAGQGLPLPITHVNFWYSSRVLAASGNKGTPLSLVSAEAAGRRIGETLEATVIGTKTGIVYGGANTALTYGNTSAVYGYTNFPQRLTKTNLTIPTATNHATTLAEILAAIDQLKANKFYGPYMIYTTNDWDQWMDGDYILTGGNVATQTLRNRIRAIEGIQDVRRLDMWFGTQVSTSTGPGGDVDATLKPYSMLIIQMTSEVAELVNGMDITTLQWETKGGMQLNFKVMAIQAPRLRADAYGNCGILHITTS